MLNLIEHGEQEFGVNGEVGLEFKSFCLKLTRDNFDISVEFSVLFGSGPRSLTAGAASRTWSSCSFIRRSGSVAVGCSLTSFDQTPDFADVYDDVNCRRFCGSRCMKRHIADAS